MTSFIKTIDNLVSAAQAFCVEPSLHSAVEFEACKHQADSAAIAISLKPYDTIKAVVVARHPVEVMTFINRAFQNTPAFLEPLRRSPPKGSSGEPPTGPIRSRYQNQR